LLAGLGGEALEAGEFGFARVDDPPFCGQRPPRRRADLGELLDHVVDARPLGRGGENADFGADGLDALDGDEAEVEFGVLRAWGGGGVEDGGVGDQALAIENLDGFAGSEAFDAQGVDGLVVVEDQG
jgi:hypothetical protein